MTVSTLQRVALLCGFGAGFFVSPLNAAPVISELFYDAAGSDAGYAFVELFGVPGQGLQDLVLEGINGSDGAVYNSVSLSGEIPEDGVFVIGDNSGESTFVNNADLIADVDFQNGPDSVVLRDGQTILDTVAYGTFSVGSGFFGEGGPAPDPAALNARIDRHLGQFEDAVTVVLQGDRADDVVATACEQHVTALIDDTLFRMTQDIVVDRFDFEVGLEPGDV